MRARIAGLLLCAFALSFGIARPVSAQTRAADAAGDVSAGYSYMHDSASLNFNGVRVSSSKTLSPSWAAVVEVGVDRNGSGVYRSSSGTHSFTYTDTSVVGGVRLRRFDGTSTMPFFQVLAGYFARRDTLNPNGTTVANFAVRTEVGLDVHVADHFALRFGGGWTFLNGGVRYMNQVGANAGVAYLFGRR